MLFKDVDLDAIENIEAFTSSLNHTLVRVRLHYRAVQTHCVCCCPGMQCIAFVPVVRCARPRFCF